MFGTIVVGWKFRAARRKVGIPAAIIPVLRDHVAIFVGPDPDSLVFGGAKGSPLRRSNFNRMTGWACAEEAIGRGTCTSTISATPGMRLRRPAARASRI